MATFKKICLVGFDRQVGSFALGLKRTGFTGPIVGVADDQTINKCWKLGMINDGFQKLDDALPGANLIMLSSVSSHVEGMLPKVLEWADDNAVISEMTRVKGDVNRVFEESGRDDIHYVGFRLIGDVVDGGDYTKSDKFFFENKSIILTPRDKRDLNAFSMLQEVMRKMGADVIAMSPQSHDRLLAQIHHVPKTAVMAVLQRLFGGADQNVVTPAMMGDWLAGETRDLMQSRSMGWVAEVEANRELVIEGIDELIMRLQSLKEEISRGNLSNQLEALVEKTPEILKEPETPKGVDLVLSAGADPKNLERVSEIMAKAHIKMGSLDRMEHAAPGTYRLTLSNRPDAERTLSLLRGAGFDVVDLA